MLATFSGTLKWSCGVRRRNNTQGVDLATIVAGTLMNTVGKEENKKTHKMLQTEILEPLLHVFSAAVHSMRYGKKKNVYTILFVAKNMSRVDPAPVFVRKSSKESVLSGLGLYI